MSPLFTFTFIPNFLYYFTFIIHFLPSISLLEAGTKQQITTEKNIYGSLKLCLPWLEIYQGFSIFRDGKGSFSFIITWEAAVLHAGSDAMAMLPSLQHHKNSWVPALMRYLKIWLLSIYIARKEIHSQAWKCLDDDTHFLAVIFAGCWVFWLKLL